MSGAFKGSNKKHLRKGTVKKKSNFEYISQKLQILTAVNKSSRAAFSYRYGVEDQLGKMRSDEEDNNILETNNSKSPILVSDKQKGVKKKLHEEDIELLVIISQLQDIFQKKFCMENMTKSMFVKSPRNV